MVSLELVPRWLSILLGLSCTDAQTARVLLDLLHTGEPAGISSLRAAVDHTGISSRHTQSQIVYKLSGTQSFPGCVSIPRLGVVTDSMHVYFSFSPYSEVTLTHSTREHDSQPENKQTNRLRMRTLTSHVKTVLYIYIYLQTRSGGKQKSAFSQDRDKAL